jgi:hypothetical protein
VPRADAGVFPNAERSHSGLVHRSRKPEWVYAHRGFESHPLRHILVILKNLVNPVYNCFQRELFTGFSRLRQDLHDGEVQEWLNWQHWKCCERETVPWVRIPPSPP